jgi:predicted TPR repeat methyltransferase
MDSHRYESAIENLEDAIRHNYQPVSHAEYLLSALRPQNGLRPMPRDFVSGLFNEYADHFDGHLVRTLKYSAPQSMFGLLNPCVGNMFEILDIGCGTGLMGKLLKPFASRIVGVDLSQDMLSRAELTSAYDQLLVADVLEFLEQCKESFNLVVSADVFIYIGELKNIFKDLSRIIPTGGLFCFSVEKSESALFSLSPKTLRYSHSSEYIQELASLNNFKIRNCSEGSIRQEHDVGVIGLCYLLEKL